MRRSPHPYEVDDLQARLSLVVEGKAFLLQGVDCAETFTDNMINSLEPTLEARVADPQRMIRAYANSAATMNMLRAYLSGGLADLHVVPD